MTYADLIAEIKLLWKRYDADDKIAVALRMTTLRAHRVDTFWRDLHEVQASFSATQEAVIDLSNTTNFPLFRQINNIRYFDPTSGKLGKFLESISPAALMDEYNIIKDDRFYIAGTNLNMRFGMASNGVQISYWKNPDTSPATYNSWIADLLPDILVQGSLAYLFNSSGNQEEARKIDRLVGFEVDPANRAPGFTLVDQLRSIGLQQSL